MDQPIELTWHRSRDLLEGGESGDSVDGAPRGCAASEDVGFTGAGRLAGGDRVVQQVPIRIAACCRRGWSALATSGP